MGKEELYESYGFGVSHSRYPRAVVSLGPLCFISAAHGVLQWCQQRGRVLVARAYEKVRGDSLTVNLCTVPLLNMLRGNSDSRVKIASEMRRSEVMAGGPPADVSC